MTDKLKILTVLLCILVVPLSGCRVGASPLAEAVVIDVIATSDFGKSNVFEREAVIDKRMNAQEVLAKVTDIEMDGSYVLEFEGLCGDDEEYWMYYINGFLSKYFASGYLIKPGDVMQWDFHSWTGTYHGSSAIIGSFPEPLLHGYEGTVDATIVVYGDGFQPEAELIAGKLIELGVQSVSVKAEGELTSAEKASNNLVLAAGNDSGMLQELNREAEALGMYAYLDKDSIKITDYVFKVKEEYGSGTGLIQCCQNPWNPLGTGSCSNVVFMVSGTDSDGVKKAVDLLTESVSLIQSGGESLFRNAYGVVITDSGEIIKTPL